MQYRKTVAVSRRRRTARVGHVGWPYSRSTLWHPDCVPTGRSVDSRPPGQSPPRPPSHSTVSHTFVGRTERLDVFANDGTTHRVVAAVIDAQHCAPPLQEGVAILLEHARAIEVAANTMVQDDHLYAKLRGMLLRGLTPGAIKAYAVTRYHID